MFYLEEMTQAFNKIKDNFLTFLDNKVFRQTAAKMFDFIYKKLQIILLTKLFSIVLLNKKF